ncbi:5-oxoprolinase subunit PxpA [Antarcticibacterium flavum]|uniref:5-oxoprolinase subunit PxpA n=1 Tax=Antarcticibacterium flavum TaxID=2058175 RepID=A0A5B7WZQ1_9FLAO|nr:MULTISPECIES: 5-oxoprolinase subunit PxpA [Antarcticibacterium]MCM4160217.1 lactam utilization protein LamB [Antarcticibacterium sp. W02-3]QCY68706.1 5-oxoprolinase subunit PxpA [Antarcticibacterium flavum]
MEEDYIHINCDLGEGGDNDEQLMPLISACNIACGGHAGTLETMTTTVNLALENGVEIGAHPSYPDKENFGRGTMDISAEDLETSLVAQILSLKQIVEAAGGKLSHVKPHGALYNDAAKDKNIAEIVINSVLKFDEVLPLFTPQNSVLFELAKGKIPVKTEAFGDRNYEENYQLVSRQKKEALITEKEAVFRHLLSMFREGKISCMTGRKISCEADTFCLHSDTPNALEILQYLHIKFREKNIRILNT